MLLYLAIGTSELTFQLFFKGIRIERYFATFGYGSFRVDLSTILQRN